MRQIREVLRLKYISKCSHREISAAVGLSKSSVSEYAARAQAQGLSWEIARGLSDAELESRLFSQVDRCLPSPRAPIDFQWVHRELKRTGITLQLLWLEYREGIIGPDLVVRDGRWAAYPRKNFSNSLRAKAPEIALPYLKRIYRTLLSRPTQSCSVLCVDDETRDYMAGRIVRP